MWYLHLAFPISCGLTAIFVLSFTIPILQCEFFHSDKMLLLKMKLKQTAMTANFSLVGINFQIHPTLVLHSLVEKQTWRNNNNFKKPQPTNSGNNNKNNNKSKQKSNQTKNTPKNPTKNSHTHTQQSPAIYCRLCSKGRKKYKCLIKRYSVSQRQHSHIMWQFL